MTGLHYLGSGVPVNTQTHSHAHQSWAGHPQLRASLQALPAHSPAMQAPSRPSAAEAELWSADSMGWNGCTLRTVLATQGAPGGREQEKG